MQICQRWGTPDVDLIYTFPDSSSVTSFAQDPRGDDISHSGSSGLDQEGLVSRGSEISSRQALDASALV